ncbi:hypothetical protein [Pseudoxanthomonas dokdonensis]
MAVASAQTVHSYRPPQKYKAPPQRPLQPYNAMAKDTTPFNCEQYRLHPHPGMQPFCENTESRTLQDEARRQGRPGPSSDVIDLPAMGSAAAIRTGLACIGGQAMRKLANGWEQVSSPNGGWQRCRGG